jgi:hypothetical protein
VVTGGVWWKLPSGSSGDAQGEMLCNAGGSSSMCVDLTAHAAARQDMLGACPCWLVWLVARRMLVWASVLCCMLLCMPARTSTSCGCCCLARCVGSHAYKVCSGSQSCTLSRASSALEHACDDTYVLTPCQHHNTLSHYNTLAVFPSSTAPCCFCCCCCCW